jgi:hypothetical protein
MIALIWIALASLFWWVHSNVKISNRNFRALETAVMDLVKKEAERSSE